MFDPNAVESGIKYESVPGMMPDLQAQLLRYTRVTIELYIDKNKHNIRKYFLEQGEYEFCLNRTLDRSRECIIYMRYQLNVLPSKEMR